MKTLTGMIAVSTVLVGSSLGLAQVQLPKLPPEEKPPVFGLNNILQVKFDSSAAEPGFICMIDRYREEEREGRFTSMRQEQRVRVVTRIVDGKEEKVEQVYTVQIPITTTGKQKVLVPAGKKPLRIDWDDAVVYRLDGTSLKKEEAQKELKTLRAVFAVASSRLQVKPASRQVRAVLRPDALIFVSETLRGK